MKNLKMTVSAVLLLVMALASGSALAAENGKFSGYMFGDYYYMAANHNPNLEKLNGFWMRRIYFAYDQKLDNGFSMRLRTEMGQPGDFTTSGKMIPFVKDAYLKWTADNGSQVLFGISPTPTWDVIEHMWGYRAVEKTPLDLMKYGSSRDFGLAVKGKLGASKKAYYHVMFANGASNKSETNKQKKIMGSLGLWLTDKILVEGYADYDGRPDDKSRNTLQGFVAYKTAKARLGVQVAYQNRKMGSGAADVNSTIWSVFGAAKVADKTTAFARVDGNSDPVVGGESISYIPFDETAKPLFIVGGLDFQLAAGVHMMPNVEMVSYSAVDAAAKGTAPDSDVMPRVTFYYKF